MTGTLPISNMDNTWRKVVEILESTRSILQQVEEHPAPRAADV